MALIYVLSQKGEKLLVHNHFIHRKEKTINEKIISKCNDYKEFNCRGRAHTIGESVVKYIDHIHVPDITKIKYKEFVNEVKEVAKTSQLTAHTVLGVVTAKVAMLTILPMGTAFFCKTPSRASLMSQPRVVFFKVTRSKSSSTTSKSFDTYLTNMANCGISLISVDSSSARLTAKHLLKFVCKFFKISALITEIRLSIVR
jgi:hypothetical protein